MNDDILILRLEVENAQLRAQLAAALEDSARLDWLGIQVFSHRNEEGDWLSHEWTISTSDEEISENDVRAAIDAARKATEAKS